MSLLKVESLSHSFIDKVLYENASFDLHKGEHMGIIGQNGAGKSTLMKILVGEIIPDKGDIKWQPNIQIGHLDQYAEIDEGYTISQYLKRAFYDLYEMEKRMNKLYEESAMTGDENQLLKAAKIQGLLEAHDFYSVDSITNKVASGLGIDVIGMDRVIGELSGGQRAKVILAKLLLEEPNILLLDEPTNFLDKEHVEWLANYLMNFEGAFIVISHDFDFLEKVTSCICDVEFGTVKKYYGKYSDFVRQKEHLRKDYIRQYYAQQKKIEKTEEYIRRNIAGVNSKIAQGRRKQLQRMERIAPPSFTHKPSIHFQELPISVQTVLEVNNLEVGYDFALLPKLNFSVMGRQKLVITGFNGVGKSTLLKTIVGNIDSISGEFHFSEQIKIGYYEQDLNWSNDSLTPLQIISEQFPKLNMKEIRHHLAACGVKDTHVSQEIRTLSGGEQSKVKLCGLLLSPCNLLILDEPTNHLDAEAKEALQKALIKFKGSIILVSHEASFYLDWADSIFHIETGIVKGV
ncbi:ABC-F family ATP-binding cassette domain-containing protein [Bacillus cereus]|uniref:ABC-F family ATP-binding cassette domain-containing protein n=1 Tax=Bacillus cereus TaxID=1396 RepID=A0AAW7NNI2_BACCE|nr:ABC-F family ATP-binding cassette domain-containing protein [Bacillus cereus]MCJ0850078.1 ATP-binding cassette domain-containing protein [Bacillus cereus]MDA2050388.1 ABC-F family ATP-binding cassette domain-containing protein [Bacillus cereus]MDN4876564.1 ABC-F family ATP-binding cassette domain-containing protein [Bacillus cereus]